MKVSLMSGVSAMVVVKDWTWQQFCEAVRKQSIPQKDESEDRKKSAMSFSCCEFSPARRKLENVVEESIWAIVLDLDHVISPERVRAYLSSWRYVAWTTWSSESDHEKWRVVIPGRVGGRAGLVRAVDTITRELKGAARVDPASRDSAHLWFFPWHRESRMGHHRIWTGEGRRWGGSGILVDFTDTPSTRPENVGVGGRNTALHRYLGGVEGRRCSSREELLDLAMEWNERLKDPMGSREVRSVVNKKWHWLAGQQRKIVDLGETRNIERWSLSRESAVPKLIPVAGDFLYPGLTLITAKMKEGKTYLASQLAVALASGTTFLNGARFPGYAIPERRRVLMVLGEDNRQTVARRIVGNMKAGHLPVFEEGMLEIVFTDRLAGWRVEQGKTAGGVTMAEAVIRGWYEEGFRVIMLDPLRAWEAALDIRDYPGTEGNRNAHTRDFLTTVWYNQLANALPGLCVLMSLHHGKNKRDHDASDPGDMIAGTTGLGAGALTTISLLPRMKRGGDEAQMVEAGGPKQRELYIHGRLTREKRLLVEQDERSGLWRCMGDVFETGLTEVSEVYFGALRDLGGMEKWVRAEEMAKVLGKKVETVHAVLGRMIKRRAALSGRVVISKRALGYRLAAAN